MLDEEEFSLFQAQEKIESLETKVSYLTNLIKFHGLDNIPMKYRKFNPSPNEFPYFRENKFKENHLKCGSLSGYFETSAHFSELDFPEDPEEFKKAKERMDMYLIQSKTMENPNLLSEMLKKEMTPRDLKETSKPRSSEASPVASCSQADIPQNPSASSQ